ncbi:hypothetical protein FSARC_10197 [Fusarium sarcochroum]|uniref:CHAT domain-containing protein n=1 Tax=Fusarium sarcochroum TaxID=1208366 RepID=A0A8H4X560_9HYPO|nr:hypothetical protein FSARC_10197 [Fusarium sarcochroum]
MEEQIVTSPGHGQNSAKTKTEPGQNIKPEPQNPLQSLIQRSNDSNDTALLTEITQVARQSLGVTGDGTEGHAKILHTLAWSLYQHYKKIEPDWDHLQEAVTLERKAIDIVPADSLNRQRYSYWLGLQLGDCFYHTGEVSKLEDAISLIQTSLHLYPEGGPMRIAHLRNLGVLFKEKYAQLGVEEDFSNAREVLEEALALASDDDHDPATTLETSADLYDVRHSKSGRLGDLETVVLLRRESLFATTEDNGTIGPDRRFLLATSLEELYGQKGSVSDLQESIVLAREAIAATSEDDSAWLTRIQFLSLRLHSLYLETGELVVLEEAIHLGKSFLEQAGEDYPGRSSELTNISVNLADLYRRTGITTHLDDAIYFGRQGLEETAKDDPGIRFSFGNLGTALASRSQATGSLVDLQEAIFYVRSALDATPDECPTRHIQLHNLASALIRRYIRDLGDLDDLNEAIALSREALVFVPADHPDIQTYLHRLASSLNYRHNKQRSARDLEESIQLSRKAMHASHDSFTGRTAVNSTLAATLLKRFKAEGSMADLDEAISASQTALSLTPGESPSRTEIWIILGGLFSSKFAKTRLDSDIEQAVDSYRSAVNHPVGQPLRRIIAATSVISLCPEFQQAYDIGRTAIDLFPGLVAARSLQTTDRQYLLSHTSGLAAATAGAALRIGKQPSEALAILEQGRGVFASSLGDIRMDIQELRHAFPELADEFVRLRGDLDSSTGFHLIEGAPLTQNDHGNRRCNAAEAFDELLVKIRENSGFEDFLGPLSMEQICAAAAFGPIVVINSSWMGCEAIIIQEQRLASLVFTNVADFHFLQETAESDRGSVETLEKLWDTITSRVLEELGFTKTPSDQQDWPHVWWIPTGPLSRFPLHASGRHQERSGKTVMDRVISSHSPSLKALVRGRRHREVTTGPSQALLVAMEHTQNQPSLPKAAEEVELVGKICESMGIHPVMPGTGKQDSLSCLPNSTIFHFAGHGHTNSDNPSKSHLLLSDPNDPLTVADLLELNLHENSPFLAYLSACSTGRVQDDRFIDESIHLISACQLAGFRHVIGTLWRVQDEKCVDVARITYETMREGGMTDDSVCRGLHRATRMLRDVWLDGVEGSKELMPRPWRGDGREARDIISCDEDWMPPAYWVPYVHFGV